MNRIEDRIFNIWQKALKLKETGREGIVITCKATVKSGDMKVDDIPTTANGLVHVCISSIDKTPEDRLSFAGVIRYYVCDDRDNLVYGKKHAGVHNNGFCIIEATPNHPEILTDEVLNTLSVILDEAGFVQVDVLTPIGEFVPDKPRCITYFIETAPKCGANRVMEDYTNNDHVGVRESDMIARVCVIWDAQSKIRARAMTGSYYDDVYTKIYIAWRNTHATPKDVIRLKSTVIRNYMDLKTFTENVINILHENHGITAEELDRGLICKEIKPRVLKESLAEAIDKTIGMSPVILGDHENGVHKHQ